MISISKSQSLFAVLIAGSALFFASESFAGKQVRARLDLSVLNGDDQPYLANSFQEFIWNRDSKKRKKRADAVCVYYGFEKAISSKITEFDNPAVVKIVLKDIFKYRPLTPTYVNPIRYQPVGRAQLTILGTNRERYQMMIPSFAASSNSSEAFRALDRNDEYSFETARLSPEILALKQKQVAAKNTVFTEITCEGDLDHAVQVLTQDTYRIHNLFKGTLGDQSFFANQKWAEQKPGVRSFMHRHLRHMLKLMGVHFMRPLEDGVQ